MAVRTAPDLPAAADLSAGSRNGSTAAGAALDEHLAEIARTPRGPRRLALFDFDGTIIHGYSALTFFQDALRHRRIPPHSLARALRLAVARELGRAQTEELLAAAVESLAGSAEADLAATGERLFRERLGGRVYDEARRLVAAHRDRGHTVVICSSATPHQVGPVARDLGVEHVLTTQLEIVDGRFTGEVTESLWSDGKLRAVAAFARKRRAALAGSWFYTDGEEDLPLLEAVGHPRPTNPDPALTRVATARGWPILRFTSRGWPGLGEVVRTGLTLSSAAPSALAALPAGLLNRDRRAFVNLAMATWGDFGTAVAGIDLRVLGEEHLWSHRPAVFLFNHQSYVDVLVLMKLIRRDLTGVAKIELRNNPVVGPVFRLGGVAFVDRSDRVQSVAALHEVVNRLRDGTSIAIAPEGTRSPTPEVQAFKKGPFRMAMEARVPIVPIVLRNAGLVLPRGARVLRPGTVDVAVLAPITVDDWTLDDLDSRVDALRDRYIETLRHWPDARATTAPERAPRAPRTPRAKPRTQGARRVEQRSQ